MNIRAQRWPARLILAIYCIYAVSPIYLSAMGGRGHLPAVGEPQRNITMGIVWVNVVLSSLADVHRDHGASPVAVESKAQDREFILIRKKRAVISETYRIRPLPMVQNELASGADREEPVVLSFRIPPQPNFRHSDIPISSHLGLSPPTVSV